MLVHRLNDGRPADVRADAAPGVPDRAPPMGFISRMLLPFHRDRHCLFAILSSNNPFSAGLSIGKPVAKQHSGNGFAG
jgi:hypothetical protein